MKTNDKVIVAFLVSVGVLSTVQAKQYVNGLSTDKKKTLISAAQESHTGECSIHEEMVSVSFDNAGVVSHISPLAELDGKSQPNF